MAWVCRNCSTDNSDEADKCFVCLMSREVSLSVDEDSDIIRSRIVESDVAEHTSSFGGARLSRHKIILILLASIFFVIGQIIQYKVYRDSARVWIIDNLFGTVPLLFVIISTILSVFSIATICYNSWHLLNNNKVVLSWVLGIISGVPFVIVPSFMGVVGLILFPIFTVLCAVKICDDYEEESISKTFGIILPIIFFVVGQISLYFSFITEQAVFLMNIILGETPPAVVIISTILGVATTIMIAVSSYRKANSSKFTSSLVLSVGVGLLNVIAPCAFAYIGVVALGIVIYMQNEVCEEWIPTVAVFASYVAGQIILYASYIRLGDIFVLTNIITKTNANQLNVLAFLITTTIIGFIASILISNIGHYFVDEGEENNSNLSVIPFATAMIICPSIVSIIGIVYAIILIIFKKKAWYKKLVMPLIGILILPILIMIPASGSLSDISVSSKPMYTVTLDKQGGIGGDNETVIRLNSAMPLLSAPQKVGYSFEGYYDAKTGGKQYYNSSMKSVNEWDKKGDFVLYAHWKPNKYRVTFDYSGGNGDIDYITVVFDSKYGVLPNPSKVGYIFDGWYCDNNKVDANSIVAVADDHKLVARWERASIIVYFDYGSGTGAQSSKVVNYGSAYGTLPSANRVGYSFSGWYYNDTRITSSSTVQLSENHTLYARYTIENYTITINATNVTVTVKRLDTNTVIKSGGSVPYNTKISITCSANSGYQNATCSPSGIYTVTGNVTIRASAEAIPSSCMAKGTKIMLADGNTVPIERLKLGDKVLAFDHMAGKYVESEIAYTYKSQGNVDSIKLFFSNQTVINLMNSGHGLYDLTLKRYVLINASTVKQYLGHTFYFTEYINGEPNGTTAALDKYTLSIENKEYYDIVTARTLNCIADGALACSDVLTGIVNVFTFAQNLQYDVEAMQLDIMQYGLYSYCEWREYISEDDFEKFNGKYFKVAIGKNILTIEELFSLLEILKTFYAT